MTSADTRDSTLIILAVLLLAVLLSGLSLFFLRLRARDELEGDLTGLEGGRIDTPGLPTAESESELKRLKSGVVLVNSTVSMGVLLGSISMRNAFVVTGVLFELPHPMHYKLRTDSVYWI